MSPEQAAGLTSGGDCFLHWHSEDRVPTQAFLHGLQTTNRLTSQASDFTLTSTDDFVSVDTRTGNIIANLPKAVSGVEYEILKPYPQYKLTILPFAGDTIMGSTGATVTSGGSALHFKAFGTDWRII